MPGEPHGILNKLMYLPSINSWGFLECTWHESQRWQRTGNLLPCSPSTSEIVIPDGALCELLQDHLHKKYYGVKFVTSTRWLISGPAVTCNIKVYLENLFLKLIYCLIEEKLLYRILLLSIKPRYESSIGMHISPPFWTSLPCPSPSHPSRLIQSPCLSFLNCTENSRWLPILHMVM